MTSTGPAAAAGDGRVPRDRDAAGRARNARPRDGLGRPLPRGMTGVPTTPEDIVLPPAEALAEAERLLAAGRPFHAHEVLEGAWKASHDDTRELWKGLAQLAVGITHARRGNGRGAVRLLTRAADRIEPYAAAAPHGVAVAALTTWARDLSARIERQGGGAVPAEQLTPRLRSPVGGTAPRRPLSLAISGQPRDRTAISVVVLPANQPETFYRGAGRIAGFRNLPALPDRPEDWVGSVTSRFGLAPAGLSTLPDGRPLAEAIAADPRYWLGPDRPDAGILVKLLDAGQRLPLHAHPDRRFATAHLSSPYGKTEAWVIVSARPDAYVHLGFTRDVAAGELAGWVSRQDTTRMLAATNRIPVAAGDAILCPAGVPHAIGDGILLVEIQEPTDFSVLLEYQSFGLADGHLGLGYELALQCVDRSAWPPARVEALRGAGRLLPEAADEFFAAHRRHGGDRLEQGFSVLVVVAGAGSLTGDNDELPLRRGDTLLVPYAAGPLRLDGPVEVIRLAAADVTGSPGGRGPRR